MRRALKWAVWLLGIPCAILVVLYLVLLITPIRLPFTGPAIRSFVQSFVPPTAELTIGDLALAIEGGVWPVIRLSPVEYRDSKTGAFVAMEALEIGFSPARALFGQPGTTVAIVRPHVQMVQDLYGPRPSRFEIVEGESGAIYTIRVLEGEDAFPPVEISPQGIANQRGDDLPMRSDNDWLVYNLEASEVSIADLVEQTAQGRFSSLAIRDGRIDMADPLYGLFRQIEDVTLEIGPAPGENRTEGEFSATIGGRTLFGTVQRSIDPDGTRRLQADVTNLDFSALMPFLDDAKSLAAMRGTGALSADVTFTADAGKIIGGEFKIDLTGIDLRIAEDTFPVVSSILDVHWDPARSLFRLDPGEIQIGESRGQLSGDFVMGVDPDYGPTIGLSIVARNLAIHPNDMPPPADPIDTLQFSGWSAPLYGALGIDRLVVRNGPAVVEAVGRADLLQQGLGLDLDLAGQGASADDVKRIWPYFLARESRDWFVANVTEGRVSDARLRFDLPAGSFILGEEKPLPPGSMSIEIVGDGVGVRPMPTMAPIAIAGETRLSVNENALSATGGGGALTTSAGTIEVRNPGLVMDNSVAGTSAVQISGDVAAPIPAILALAREHQPALLKAVDLPVSLDSLSGLVDLGLVANFSLDSAVPETLLPIDYVVNGTVSDFASSEPLEGRSVANGAFAFSASQDGYQLGGTAEIDSVVAELAVSGTPSTQPSVGLAATVSAEDLASFGFDASEFLSGQVQLSGQPLPDGTIQANVDLAGAGLDFRDLGLSKALGTPGSLSATIHPGAETTRLENLVLAFGSVRLEGNLEVHPTDGLVAARFNTVQLSEGDSATIDLSAMDGGYAVRIQGTQLDLKPVLGRFFSLDTGSGGIEPTQLETAIRLDVTLERALGFYATTAFNVDLDLSLRDGQLTQATASAQFDEGNAVSITSNQVPNGRTLSVAFNDAGTILRLLGVYSQLAGGSGSLVMTTNRVQNVEIGQLDMRDFAIVDEANVVQVLGNHSDSRAAIAASNRLDFDAGQVDFVRSTDSVEVTRAVLTGDTVGGTLRGFIYTTQGIYDLTGTYVPLFGLNNIFQQLPVLGPLLGGREGEGLVGVTFAVRGPLDQPQFLVNPLSILAPGFLREIFEFRAREVPPEQ